MISKEDIKTIEEYGIQYKDIQLQLEKFRQGNSFVRIEDFAGLNNGILKIDAENFDKLVENFDKAIIDRTFIKFTPASGSATRMFKELYYFINNYDGSTEAFLKFITDKTCHGMFTFFEHIEELPFYERLKTLIHEDGENIDKLLNKHEYLKIISYILDNKKGLKYAKTPKALIDFHIYRDFVRTAFDEHLVEATMLCKDRETVNLHFTISEDHEKMFKSRLKKVTKAFEKQYKVKYNIGFSFQEKFTDTVSLDKNNNIVRDEKGSILFRPGGHGALIHNLNQQDADIVFIKNIDNIAPDRIKEKTLLYKKVLTSILVDAQNKIFEYLHDLDDENISEEKIEEIYSYTNTQISYRNIAFPKNDKTKQLSVLRDLLNRPIRVCGMVKNEKEPGGGPFWVKKDDNSCQLMILESAQINLNEDKQQEIFKKSSHFNPVDIVCSFKDYKGNKFDLNNFIDSSQVIITKKSYNGKDIQALELPGLWNGAMANWISIFVEIPSECFTPVKTIFDLFRVEHKNVFK